MSPLMAGVKYSRLDMSSCDLYVDDKSASDELIKRTKDAISKSKELPLGDAVYYLTQYNDKGRRIGQKENAPEVIIRNVFIDHDATLINDLISKSRLIKSYAFSIGDKYRNGIITWEDGLKELERRVPGFGIKTYQSVINLGYIQSR